MSDFWAGFEKRAAGVKFFPGRVLKNPAASLMKNPVHTPTLDYKAFNSPKAVAKGVFQGKADPSQVERTLNYSSMGTNKKAPPPWKTEAGRAEIRTEALKKRHGYAPEETFTRPKVNGQG